MRRRHSPMVTIATLSLVVAGCGTSLPTKADAAAVLSKAIASPHTITLPAATYCMTANPDFSFTTMGQVDLVEMLQNVKDRESLYAAATAGAIRVELTEYRFEPAGRSPHPSCDGVHAQSKQSGYTGGQIRLAVVRTTLTPAGTAAGVQFDRPVEVATREVVDVTDVRNVRGGAAVTYTWRWTPTKMADIVGYKPPAPQEASARLRKSDEGWVVEDAGLRTPSSTPR